MRLDCEVTTSIFMFILLPSGDTGCIIITSQRKEHEQFLVFLLFLLLMNIFMFLSLFFFAKKNVLAFLPASVSFRFVLVCLCQSSVKAK